MCIFFFLSPLPTFSLFFSSLPIDDFFSVLNYPQVELNFLKVSSS